MDSRSIAYRRTPSIGVSRGQRFEVWTIGIDGGPPSRIYQADCCPEDSSAPVWSPDGEYIAFWVLMPGSPEVSGTAVIRPDGTDLRWLSAERIRPEWQPIPIPDAGE